jgi:hypothetical protein
MINKNFPSVVFLVGKLVHDALDALLHQGNIPVQQETNVLATQL